MIRRTFALLALLSLAACGGNGNSASAPVAPIAPAPVKGPTLVPTSFAVQNAPTTSSASARAAKYLGANAVSIAVTLVSVDGSAPQSTLPLTVNQTLAPAQCPCAVVGPYAPVGTDVFRFTSYDGPNATGNAIASATFSTVIAAGQATSGSVTLSGIAQSFTLGVPNGVHAGRALTSTLFLSVRDADGNAVTGAFASPIVIVDSDTSGAQGSMLVLNGGTAASSVAVTNSADVVQIVYGGLAIPPATISASATGATTAAATYAPELAPIVYAGPLNGATPEVDVFGPTGSGSTASFTVSEHGLTDAPYNRTLTATAGSSCAAIGTVAPANGTTFTLTAVASPAFGTCTITVADGLGQTAAVDASYLQTTIGIR